MENNIFETRVKEVMSRDLVTIRAQDSAGDALQLMVENKVSTLPVVDRNDRCVGIVSTSDFVEITRDLELGLDELQAVDELLLGHVIEKLSDDFNHQLVLDLMSDKVITTDPEEYLAPAASRMLRERIHHLPVVDCNRHLVGIISTTDIITAFVHEASTVVGQ